MPEATVQSERLDVSVWKIVSVAVLGSLLAQLDATVVNVSLSSLAADLHSTLSTIQWVTSGYLLALALMLPLNGWLVERIGAKSVYLWCFSTFTLCSALCGTAWSATSLIAFRVLQGMSGGLIAPMLQMMMARAAGKQMPRVMGYAAMPIVLGPILGPVVAGAILEYASWRWLFLINLPIGLLAIVLAMAFLPNDREETRAGELDLTGFALLSPGLVLFLFGSEHVKQHLGLTALLISIALLVAFFRDARRKGDRALIHLDLFRGVFSLPPLSRSFFRTASCSRARLSFPSHSRRRRIAHRDGVAAGSVGIGHAGYLSIDGCIDAAIWHSKGVCWRRVCGAARDTAVSIPDTSRACVARACCRPISSWNGTERSGCSIHLRSVRFRKKAGVANGDN